MITMRAPYGKSYEACKAFGAEVSSLGIARLRIGSSKYLQNVKTTQFMKQPNADPISES